MLRYESGQHYDSHYDIFEPESYGPQPSQRVRHARAFVWYLQYHPLPTMTCMQRVVCQYLCRRCLQTGIFICM